MRKAKKIASVLTGVMMAAALAACGSSTGAADRVKAGSIEMKSDAAVSEDAYPPVQQSAGDGDTAADIMAGSWEVNPGSLRPEDNGAAMQAFDKAMEGHRGYDEVLAVMGSQMVQGTNYAYLCRAGASENDGDVKYVIVYVGEDPDGSAELVNVHPLFSSVDDKPNGGWVYNRGDSSPESDPRVKDSVDEALQTQNGPGFEQVANIGAFPDKEGRIAVLCRRKGAAENDRGSYALVIADTDRGGSAHIAEIIDVVLSLDDNMAVVF